MSHALQSLLLVIIVFGCVGYWVYSLVTYDWTKFDEDSADDDFLKPYEDKDRKQ